MRFFFPHISTGIGKILLVSFFDLALPTQPPVASPECGRDEISGTIWSVVDGVALGLAGGVVPPRRLLLACHQHKGAPSDLYQTAGTALRA